MKDNINNGTKERILWVDYCKAVAIFLVIVGHVFTRTNTFSLLNVIIYSFHMPVFFFLSGYTFDNNVKFFVFLKKKARTLLLPAIMFSILFFVLYCGMISITSGRNGLMQYLNTFLPVSDGVVNTLLMTSKSRFSNFWFLPVLFCAELLLYYILRCKYVVAQLVLILAGVAINVLLSDGDVALPLGFGEAMLALPFLFFGYYSRKNRVFETTSPTRKVQVALLAFIYIIAMAIWIMKGYGVAGMYDSHIENIVLFYVAAFTGCVVFVVAVKYIGCCIGKSSKISYVGKKSLYIFGVHYIFLEWFAYFSNGFSLSTMPMKLLWDGVGICSVFVCSLIGTAAICRGKL